MELQHEKMVLGIDLYAVCMQVWGKTNTRTRMYIAT